MLRDVRQTRFPCLVVDFGADGNLDLSRGISDRGYYTFYVLDSAGTERREVDIFQILERMFRLGKAVTRMMRADSADISLPCYGLDSSSIGYNRIGPVGMQCYGYAFNYTMTRDHEQ